MFSLTDIIERFPAITPREPSSVIFRFVSAFQDEQTTYAENLQDIKESNYIDTAKTGTRSVGQVEFSIPQDATATIPKGTRLQSSDGFIFLTTEDVSVDPIAGEFWQNDWGEMEWAAETQSTLITVTADIIAEETGTAYNVPADDITTLLDPIPGVQNVTNPVATRNGAITDLDEIGKMFGDIGRRLNRTDRAYRQYLQSLVNVFQFRGTVPGVIAAVSTVVGAADPETGVSEEDIEVYEHCNDDPPNPEQYLEYTINIYDWIPHQQQTVEDLAQLSDASMSRLRKVSYKTPEDEVGIQETIGVGEAIITENTVDNADIISINSNTTSLSDVVDASVNITVTDRAINTANWGESGIDWSFFEWVES